MLQVRMLSGEAVASIPAEELEELSDISGLKKRLSQLQGLAPRFRQRLLLRGEILEETATLHSPMGMHLVCLPFADVSQSQVNDLAAAAERGSYATVESMLQLPQDPDLPDVNGCTALRRASHAGHLRIVRLLLEAGASKHAADNEGHKV